MFVASALACGTLLGRDVVHRLGIARIGSWGLGLTNALLAGFLLTFCCTASWADSLHRLSGTQIRAQFTGKVLTDGTHWRETYGPGGKLLVEEMDHAASNGSWHIKADQLCKVRPGLLNDCYEVWAAGDRVELRLGKFPPLEAFLRPAVAQ